MTILLGAILIVEALAVLAALRSLAGGFRFLGFVVASLEDPPAGDLPPALVIAPMKAGDGLAVEAHVANLLAQDYPSFRVRFVVESESDPAWQPLVWAAEANPDRVEVVVAERADGCGQKVHNLRVATADLPADVGVLAFVDADVAVAPDWLRRLVGGLQATRDDGRRVLAATGYRHFVADRPTAAAEWATAWNGQILTLFGRDKSPFVWGGSWSIQSAAFARLGIRDAWDGALSDDYVATAVIRSAGGAIQFVPQCVGPSEPPATWLRAWAFVVRQLAITARCSGRLFVGGYVLIVLHTLGVWAGLAGGLAAAATARGWWAFALLAAAGIVQLAGMAKALLRTRSAEILLPLRTRSIRRDGLAAAAGYGLFLLPTWAAMTRAACCRTIRWRDATYRLTGSGRVAAMSRDA